MICFLERVEEDTVFAEKVGPSRSVLQNPAPVKIFCNNTWGKTNKQTNKQKMTSVHLGSIAEACQPSTAKQSNMAERWEADADEESSACSS